MAYTLEIGRTVVGGANQCVLETTALSSPVRATDNRSAVASERYSFNVKKK